MPSGLSCMAATHQPVSASCCCSTGYIQCVSYLKKILYLSMCLSICLNISTVCIYVSAYLCTYVFMYVFAYSFACSYSPFYPFIYLCVFCRTLNTNTTKKTPGQNKHVRVETVACVCLPTWYHTCLQGAEDCLRFRLGWFRVDLRLVECWCQALLVS